jgi:hypothetical protein
MRKNPALFPLRPNVLLKARVYYMVAYVNSDYLMRKNNENYAVVQAKFLTKLNYRMCGQVVIY